MSRASLDFVLSRPAYFFAFGLGTGLSPFAPGTVASLATIPLYFLMAQFSPALFFVVVGALFLIGIWICDVTGRALGVADYGGIVWDEMIAFLLVLYFIPQKMVWFAAAFFVFRLFDIWKPFPIRYFDRTFKNGFGVMLDDLLAALYSLASLQLVAALLK